MNKQNESINNMYKLSPDTLDHRMSIEQIDSNKIEKLLREMLEKVGRRLNNNKTDTLEPPIKLTNNEECQTEITCKSLLDETKKLKNTLHHAIVEKDKIIIENKYLIKEIAAKKA